MPRKSKSGLPIWKHPNGQWVRRLGGKTYHFGTDRDAALARYEAEWPFLSRGLVPPSQEAADEPTLAELGNLFHAACERRVAAGTLYERAPDDYRKTIGRLIEFVGRSCRVTALGPLHWAAIADQFAEPIKRAGKGRGLKGRTVTRRSPITVAGDIRRVRTFLTWASRHKLIAPVDFGEEFAPPGAKQMRRHRAKVGRQDLTAEQIRAVLAHCSPGFRPIVLLGINAGLGNFDISQMRMSDVPEDLTTGEVFIDLPRHKTGAGRRFWLWPETAEAIAAYLAKRPSPAGLKRTERLLFLTRFGLEWVRGDGKERKDSIGASFKKARIAAGLDRGAFYDLRRSFRTVADQTRDFPCVELIMGHAPPADDMSSRYRQHIDDDRIRAVCEHVRRWMFPNVGKSEI